MGRLGTENTVITKTTNAIIILPKDHHVVVRMEKNLDIEKRRASSSCCQCRTCTDMCSRHALGHPIEPHKVMRAVANHDLSDLSVFINAAYCSGCGICEKYACPQGLSPKSIIQQFKGGLRGAGIKVEKVEPAPVLEDRELRKLPVHRLAARLDLARYDKPAPFEDTTPVTKLVKIPMSQHIGAPATRIKCCNPLLYRWSSSESDRQRSSSKRKVRSIKREEKNYGQSNWYGRMHNSIYWF